ncbi:MAG: zf-TFIIB domain-containing protein [Bacteroidales bacterium]
MNCPKCNNLLLISNTQGVEIDHCPNCRGIWLDRGELEKIIERSNMYNADSHGSSHAIENERYGHEAYRHDGHSDKHHDSHHGSGYDSHSGNRQNSRHKKGFLSDLFDF